jgi:hypothetical protein
MLEERQRRIGENEAIFRDVNQMARPLDPALMTILCECGDAACRDQLAIAHDEYERVRNDSTQFIIRPGHEAGETEEVVSKHLEFWIVRKRPGLPAEIARRTDHAG